MGRILRFAKPYRWYLVAALRDRGVEAYGVDISEYAISKVREDIKPYCCVGSLTESLPKQLPETYDLVVTIEVLEHLSIDLTDPFEHEDPLRNRYPFENGHQSIVNRVSSQSLKL